MVSNAISFVRWNCFGIKTGILWLFNFLFCKKGVFSVGTISLQISQKELW